MPFKKSDTFFEIGSEVEMKDNSETESENADEMDEDIIDYTEFMAGEAIAYATTHGANFGINTEIFSHAPITLLPTVYPSGLFELAKVMSPYYNKMTDRISRNQLTAHTSSSKKPKLNEVEETWLQETLRGTICMDEFTKKLMDVYVENLAFKNDFPDDFQHFSLGILRSDYMVNEDPKNEGTTRELLQVELNTIAASLGFLSPRICETHKYLCRRYPHLSKELIPNKLPENDKIFLEMLPENNSDKVIGNCFRQAHEVFCKLMKLENSERVSVLFIVQNNERNSFDQRLLEYFLTETYNIKVIRKTLSEIYRQARLMEVKKKKFVLTIGEEIISVAYFRAGYTPNDYKTFDSNLNCEEWEARRLIEKSFAIKCPTISYHLAGTKKVQQRLAVKGQLELFMSESNEVAMLRKSFANLWTLDENEQSSEDREAEKLASNLATCNGFVMKPQREGGGNNFYGAQIPKKLAEMSTEEKAGYILMQRIFPKSVPVKFLKQCKVTEGNGLCELGTFGVFLGNGSETIVNEYAGYLLRTKNDSSDEGGVATGYSCLGSVCLS